MKKKIKSLIFYVILFIFIHFPSPVSHGIIFTTYSGKRWWYIMDNLFSIMGRRWNFSLLFFFHSPSHTFGADIFDRKLFYSGIVRMFFFCSFSIFYDLKIMNYLLNVFEWISIFFEQCKKWDIAFFIIVCSVIWNCQYLSREKNFVWQLGVDCGKRNNNFEGNIKLIL